MRETNFVSPVLRSVRDTSRYRDFHFANGRSPALATQIMATLLCITPSKWSETISGIFFRLEAPAEFTDVSEAPCSLVIPLEHYGGCGRRRRWTLAASESIRQRPDKRKEECHKVLLCGNGP